MRTLAPLALAFALALALAGCVAPEAPAPEEAAATEAQLGATAEGQDPGAGAGAGPGARTGTLVVLARMPDATILPGVRVSVGNETRTTGVDGEAKFELAPGDHVVEARKEAHRTALLNVTVRAGETLRTEAVLAALDNDQHAHEKGIFAHRDLYTFEGRFDCSATYVIITGDCLLLVDNVTTQAGAPATPGDATAERNIIDFPLDAGWTTLVVEMTWSATAPTPATGSGMTLALEPAEAPADGHAAKYARAAGETPLQIRMVPGVEGEGATTGDLPNPAGGEVIRARAFVMGVGHKPAGTDFLGVSVAKDQTFQLYVSIFYEEPAPEGYTAIGGA